MCNLLCPRACDIDIKAQHLSMCVQIKGASKQGKHCEALPEGCQALLQPPEDEIMPPWPGVQSLVQAVPCQACSTDRNALIHVHQIMAAPVCA